MSDPLAPDEALAPASFERCYWGALELADRSDRLAAAYALVALGRLGLTPGELLHLHEGWVDWDRGELRVPAHDPCACALCWEHARVAQRRGDPRPLATIVDESQWAGTARTVPFGWSRRITGLLATALAEWPYFDRSAEDLRILLAGSARLASDVDPDAVDFRSLRAAAARFFAAVGFDAGRVAATLGVDHGVATAFTAETPGAARTPDLAALADSPEATALDDDAYELVRSHETRAGEPFDPADFDPAWRSDRAAAADEEAPGSPRPAVVPDGIDPSQAGAVETADEGAAPSAAATADGGDGAGGTAVTAGDSGGAVGTDAAADDTVTDLADLVTEPVELVVHTRFACPSLLRGRPSGGRVVIGQSELVLAAHGGGAIKASVVVPLADVRDVAFGWAPERFAEIFDTTVGIAFEQDGDRQTAVVELPEGQWQDFSATFFEGIVTGVPAVAKHPAAVGGRTTDAEVRRCALGLADGHLELAPSPGADPDARIALADVVDVEPDARTLGADVGRAIALEHIAPGSRPIRSVVAPTTAHVRTLLERYLVADHRRREQAATDVTLPTTQQDVLGALHTTNGAKDLAQLLGLGRQELTETVEELAAAGLVHNRPDGVYLTGKGRLRADEDRSEADR